MTERIRELLGEAVSGLEPKNRDPVASVIRRGRAARRRTTMLAAAVATVLLAGGLVVGQQMVTSVPTASGGIDQDPTPRIAGGMVVAGAMQLPIPDGWKVVTATTAAKCGMMPKTILLIVSSQRGCQNAPVEISRAVSRNPGGSVLFTKDGKNIVYPPVSVTLAGGEPAWLTDAMDSDEMKPGRYPEGNYFDQMLLPWSGVLVVFRESEPASQRILDAIRTSPGGGGALTLPATALTVELTMPGASAHGSSKDPATAAAVLRLLHMLTSEVRDTDACAGPKQQNVRLQLTAPTASRSPLTRSQVDAGWSNQTTVIIALGGDCQEAVSSDGGRVRLGDAAVTELKRLLGIGTR